MSKIRQILDILFPKKTIEEAQVVEEPVAEDQLSGLYDEPRYKDYTPDQIADIANYVYLTMGLPENLLGKYSKGDTV